MFHFTGFSVLGTMYSSPDGRTLLQPGYPIRKSTGQSVCAALRGLSQLVTSFFACWHQGIHHVPFVAGSIRSPDAVEGFWWRVEGLPPRRLSLDSSPTLIGKSGFSIS